MNALIYGLVAVADRDNLGTVVDVLANMRSLRGARFAPLPLTELAAFGFELLIRKALENGWEEVFAASQSYKDYAAVRAADGLA